MPDEITEIDISKIIGTLRESSVQQLVLYIPNKDKNGKEIKHLQKWIREAQKILTVIGEGATTMPPAGGAWLKEKSITSIDQLKDKDLLLEKTTLMYTYICADRFEKNLITLREFLHRFGRETNQGEVVFEFDGKFYRITKYDQK